MNQPVHQPVHQPTGPRKPGWRSLSTRLGLSTAAVFLLGVWSLAFYASRTLQQDLQALLGAQQLSTVAILANDVNRELAGRLRAADSGADWLAPLMTGPPAALQVLLDQRPLLQRLFNGGVVVLAADGTALADAPRLAGRSGQNYSNNPDVAAVLRGAPTTVSRPAVGRALNAPAFAVIAPMHDTQGRVVGALMGLTNLALPNFLDTVGNADHGQSGGFLLIAPQHGLVITATDKTRVMEAMPAPGLIPPIDRFLQGHEGTAVYVDARGVEVLTSARRVPATGWIVASALPTAEAFAPVRTLQQRIGLATLGLSVLAAGLIGWLTRRQLAPMHAAAQALAAQAGANQPLQPLPPGRADEVGALIGGFNLVLAALASRETLLRQGDAALRASEQRFRDTFRLMPAALTLQSAEGVVLDCSDVFCQAIGQARDDVIGRSTLALGLWAEPGDRLAVHEALQRDGQVQGFEYRQRHRDGGITVRQVSASYLTIGGERLLLTIAHDITERKRAEAALRASETRFRTLVEHAPYCIHEIDRAGRVTLMNPAGLKMLGTDAESAVLGLPYLAGVGEPDRPRIAGLLAGALAGQPAVFAFQGNGGQQYESSFIPIADEQGSVQRLMGLSIDVTERRQVELANRESEMRLRLVIRGGDLGFWDWDLASDGLIVNERWCTMLGLDTLDAAQGIALWRTLVHPEDAPKLARVFEQMMLGPAGRDGEVEIRARHSAGHYIWILNKFSLTARAADGRPLRVVGTHLEITARKHAELALQASVQEKTALLNEVHHRVKNNLQVITSLLRLEAGRSSHAPTQSVLAEMQGRIRAMALLHESVYRAGTFAAIDLGVYLRLVATQAFRSLRTSSAAVRLRLELGSVQAGLDQATPCGLLLAELMGNALKHAFPAGAGGEVAIALQPVPGGAAGQWCLRVSDNGVGLPADFAARQQDSLGLQLVSSLARQLGGSLVVGAGTVAGVGAAASTAQDRPANGPSGSSFAVTFAVTAPAPLVVEG